MIKPIFPCDEMINMFSSSDIPGGIRYLVFQQESSSGRSDRVHTYNEDSRTKVLVEVEEKTTL